MIALDTSALMAILLEESFGPDCESVLIEQPKAIISAGTLAEASLVSERRKMRLALDALLGQLSMTIIVVDEPEARRVAAAHAKWGRGVHPAALNFGDCFAYAVAKRYDCPLLFIGDDFSKTDITSALSR